MHSVRSQVIPHHLPKLSIFLCIFVTKSLSADNNAKDDEAASLVNASTEGRKTSKNSTECS